jgi:hypothetical protein
MNPTESLFFLPYSPLDGWEFQALGEAQLGNSFRTRRACLLARDLAAAPQSSIPLACGSWKKTKAAYRFFDLAQHNPDVPDSPELDAPDAIRLSYFNATKKRLAGQMVLAIQDTTDLDLSHGLALQVHTTLALSLAGVPMGLLSQLVWTRDPEDNHKSERRRELPIEEKESGKWLAALAQSQQNIILGTTLVHVGDREADIYDLFLAVAQTPHAELLVRACRDRKLGENSYLFEFMAMQPILEIKNVSLPRADERPAKTVLMSLRCARVTLKPPKHRKIEKLPEMVIDAIFVEEMYPIDEKKKVQWLLLTTLAVESTADAWERVRWYKLRWRIERYHLVLKSGCKIEERQLATVGRMSMCLAMYSIVASRLLELMYGARENPLWRADILLEKEEWEVVYGIRYPEKELPKEAPTLQELVREIAGLGGFLGRKGDGQPGVKTLWLGLRRLQDILIGYRWARLNRAFPFKNLGND